MKTALSWIIAGAFAFSLGQAAVAEVVAPKPAATLEKPSALTDAEKKAKAKECSDLADAKKLHGEARKAFRAKCKKG
ncbi:hypothetical protein [Methylocapsa aurea]|uniref:hypothetical protein n=1 Tax=Methylocapsa aurea TaxID=663610 RepID=UPI000566A787|nr:hypothetical protein [Methylocapsa aurea]